MTVRETIKDLTWKRLWNGVKVDLYYPVRILGLASTGVAFTLAFWQTQLGTVPSWLMWTNAALLWIGAKITERKTHSDRYISDNSDDHLD